jgi:hypothetical protein
VLLTIAESQGVYIYIYTGFELAITNCCPCICPNQQGTTSSIEHTMGTLTSSMHLKQPKFSPLCYDLCGQFACHDKL